ncbi:MAG TPA: type III polyketide synthase [Nordella sp.]|nr:type III polyketide synthase [Nordella sp.]
MRSQLMAVATASPPFELRTEDVIEEATRIFAGRHRDFERMMPVFANTGIRRRQSVRPYNWFRAEQGWPERTEAYVEGATDLFRKAAGEALAQAGMEAGEIDTIVTVSSTGIATPSIEARVMHGMGFHKNVSRIPVFGLGCAGGATGLALASRLAQQPASNVLLVVIELCTLAFRPDEMTKSNIIATALFGDGAAACVLSGKKKDGLAAIEFTGEHSWPDTLDIMGWRMDPQGFGAIFSQRIPDFVTQELRAAADGFLERNGLTVSDIGQFVFHPGGAKVISALEQVFHLDQGTLEIERQVLADHGNMSAPTLLFVLNEALKKPFTGRRFLSALGPGFTSSFATMVS